MTLQVGAGSTVDVSAGGQIGDSKLYIAEYKAYGQADASGNLTIKFVVAENSNISWLAFKNLNYTKLTLENITISEDATYTPASKYANVTFKRTLVEGWNGLVLPFDMSVEDAKTTFTATEVKDFESVTYTENKGATLNFVDATEIKAGRPFMIKAAAGTSYTINGVILPGNALQTVEKSDEGSNAIYTFTGTYAGTTDLTDVTFALFNGTKYYYHTAGNNSSSAKAFRGYFVNNTPSGNAGSRISFNFGDGETTAIESVETMQNANGTVYNLNGQRVEKAQKGLYIVNGKKTVVR